MWLSEHAGARRGGGARAEIGGVTIGGAKAAVLLDGERRDLGVISPPGLRWRPAAGDQVLVLETDDGETWILGAAVSGETAGAPREGELCLRSGGAWLRLSPDGTISAEGELHIGGDVYLTGRLFLNGAEIKAEGDGAWS